MKLHMHEKDGMKIPPNLGGGKMLSGTLLTYYISNRVPVIDSLGREMAPVPIVVCVYSWAPKIHLKIEIFTS